MKIMPYRVTTDGGCLVAACFDPSLAVQIVALFPDGAQVRRGKRVVFTEGKDGTARESIDRAVKALYANEGRPS